MDLETFTARARTASKDVADPPATVTLDVDPGCRPHPLLPDVPLLSELVVDGEARVLRCYYGSFLALEKAETGFDIDTMLRERIEAELGDLEEEEVTLADLKSEDDLLGAHARFRRGMDVPRLWYRRGDLVSPCLWAVDMDLFLELRLRWPEWESVRGKPLVLQLGKEPLPLEIPEDAAPDDAWTIEEAGLIDDIPDEDDEDPAPPKFGDLHVLPLVR